MKLKKFLQTIAFVALTGSVIALATSCKEDETKKLPTADPGSVVGVVTDSFDGTPMAGVTVLAYETESTTTTAADGSFTLTNVPMDTRSIVMTKTGYQTVSVSVNASDYNSSSIATVNRAMAFNTAKIVGTVYDGTNGSVAFSGVTIKVSDTKSVTSSSTGTYSLENLMIDDYVVTFSKVGFLDAKKNIKKSDFIDGVVTINLKLGEPLPGVTIADIEDSVPWYYNDQRGGRSSGWDWSYDYMCSIMPWVGNWEEQNEGTTMRIRNDGDQRNNPADLVNFDTFTYGRKKITEDNCIMTLSVRTHGADAAAPAYYGVKVVDLNAATVSAVNVGTIRTYGDGNYSDITFDLTPYVGKEIAVAIGIYRQQTGDYWKQLVIRRIAFAKTGSSNTATMPGEEVITGWRITKEMVRSTMPTPVRSFTGISPVSGNRDGYVNGYRSWAAVNHIAYGWSYVYVNKDCEPFASDGYTIKTRGTDVVSTTLPEAYLYAKFNISAGNNKFTFTGRNYTSGSAGSRPTFIKLTVMKEDGTYAFIAPNTAQSVATQLEVADNGCWKFKHEAGTPSAPTAYGKVVYDLSAYNGQSVVVAFGVFNGVANTSENKFAFYNVDIN